MPNPRISKEEKVPPNRGRSLYANATGDLEGVFLFWSWKRSYRLRGFISLSLLLKFWRKKWIWISSLCSHLKWSLRDVLVWRRFLGDISWAIADEYGLGILRKMLPNMLVADVTLKKEFETHKAEGWKIISWGDDWDNIAFGSNVLSIGKLQESKQWLKLRGSELML